MFRKMKKTGSQTPDSIIWNLNFESIILNLESVLCNLEFEFI